MEPLSITFTINNPKSIWESKINTAFLLLNNLKLLEEETNWDYEEKVKAQNKTIDDLIIELYTLKKDKKE